MYHMPMLRKTRRVKVHSANYVLILVDIIVMTYHELLVCY